MSFDEKGNLMLTYNHGKLCTDDGKVEWKTEIIFTCDKNSIVRFLKYNLKRDFGNVICPHQDPLLQIFLITVNWTIVSSVKRRFYPN